MYRDSSLRASTSLHPSVRSNLAVNGESLPTERHNALVRYAITGCMFFSMFGKFETRATAI